MIDTRRPSAQSFLVDAQEAEKIIIWPGTDHLASNYHLLSFHLELMAKLKLTSLMFDELNSHGCVDWLKTHETHFSWFTTVEIADLLSLPKKLS